MNESQKKTWLDNRKRRRENQVATRLFEGIRSGSIPTLSKAITLLESSLPADQLEANALINYCLPFTGNSIRIGITGVPGVGKSTFIESFGQHLLALGLKIAVLAIDPTSQEGGGSILGDKTRMYTLSQAENAFIRPSPSGNSLGGVARKTRESILLAEAAGFDVILIETVGVGQSETLVHSMVDVFLLLMLAGAGDELQGIKRGIMELADILVINKADGDNIKKADLAAREYKNALHLFPPNANGWIPRTMTCSALEKDNISKVWENIESYRNQNQINGWFDKKRKDQEIKWFREALKENIIYFFMEKNGAKNDIKAFESAVKNQELTPHDAAEKLVKKWLE